MKFKSEKVRVLIEPVNNALSVLVKKLNHNEKE